MGGRPRSRRPLACCRRRRRRQTAAESCPAVAVGRRAPPHSRYKMALGHLCGSTQLERRSAYTEKTHAHERAHSGGGAAQQSAAAGVGAGADRRKHSKKPAGCGGGEQGRAGPAEQLAVQEPRRRARDPRAAGKGSGWSDSRVLLTELDHF